MVEKRFNIEAAIELYYSQNDLRNKDIMLIFGCSSGHASTLKKRVVEAMVKEDVRPVVYDANNVNTEYAFKVWGLDITELEKKFKQLMKFRKLRGDAPAEAATA